MSLHLTIQSDKLYKSKKTGVFVKDSGGVRELETLDEIKIFFPEFDTNTITQEYHESYNVWEGNLTHNLAYLASYITIKQTSLYYISLYYLLWKPENIGIFYLDKTYIELIKKAVDELKNNTDLNKYGSESEISELLNFIQSLYNCISSLNINFSDEFKIISER